MSEATILAAIAHQLADAIEQVRAVSERQAVTFDEPVTWQHRGEARVNGAHVYDSDWARDKLPKSRRDLVDRDNWTYTGYEWWPALEPLFELAERVASYRDKAGR